MTGLQLDDVVVEHRSRGRGLVRAVDGVSLGVTPGQVVGLVGESGCGKSTIARAVCGLEPVTAGRVSIDGVDVERVGWRRRSPAQVAIQMVFQSPYASLNPRRTVGSQIADGVPDGVAPTAEVERLLGLVGLDSAAAQRYPHQFSGGQRQRVAIARALAPRPSILVADEPVTALDASAQAQIVNLIVELVEGLDLGVLFISHDLALIREVADSTAVMYLGRIVESGPSAQVWSTPAHPYTKALIEAVPRISATPHLPRGLGGEVPDAADIPTGCRFRSRCPVAIDRCHEDPPTVRVGDQRADRPQHAACWLAAERTSP